MKWQLPSHTICNIAKCLNETDEISENQNTVTLIYLFFYINTVWSKSLHFIIMWHVTLELETADRYC